MLYLGVDSGGTRTRVLALDEGGQVVHRGDYPSAYLPAVGEEGVVEVLRQILAHLPQAPVRAVLGLGGYGEAASWDQAYHRAVARVLGEGFLLLNDVELAWRAAFRGQEGIVVISGTGSMAFGRGPKGQGRAGGFGHLFGDEGSAYWIGVEALRLASKAMDGRAPHTSLVELPRMFHHDSLASLTAFLMAEPSQQRARVAALAQEVDRLAKEDWGAQRVLREAGEELAQLALALVGRLGVTQVAPLGGVFRSLLVRGVFQSRMEAAGVTVVPPLSQPEEEAARLAWGGAGV